ncbi:Kinase, NEK [Giardia muris]|uniref:Kinase, NEK n=1 Tax=Giardia muris TaxID=5742 RepID=A0A4Z1SNB5_GIAMU|nr:Kinase, NEK [Giardia muris]|eukprot:TNJ27226.1 Kinase, NEK [Giardia muris]
MTETALMRAAMRGDAEGIIANVGELGERDGSGTTALMYAAFYGHVECLEYIVGNEARLQDRWGKTALMYAAAYGRARCVELLRAEAGLRTERESDWALNGRNLRFEPATTALMLAAAGGHARCLPLLISEEAGMRNHSGETALIQAVISDKLECVQVLSEHETKLRTKAGETALMYAAKLGRLDCARLLLAEAGLRNEENGSSGTTALMLAARMGFKDIVKLLKPFEGDLLDLEGHPPRWYALKGGHVDVVRLLDGEGEQEREEPSQSGSTAVFQPFQPFQPFQQQHDASPVTPGYSPFSTPPPTQARVEPKRSSPIHKGSTVVRPSCIEPEDVTEISINVPPAPSSVHLLLLQKENDGLHEKLSEACGTVARLEAELADARKHSVREPEYRRLVEHKNSLAATVHKLETDVRHREAGLRKAQERTREAERRLHTLAAELDALRGSTVDLSVYDDLLAAYQSLEQDLHALTQRHDELVGALQSSLIAKDTELRLTRERLDVLVSKEKSLQRQLADLEAELATAKMKAPEEDGRVAHLQSLLRDKDETISRLEGDVSTAQEQLTSLLALADAQSALQARLAKLDDENRSLRAQLARTSRDDSEDSENNEDKRNDRRSSTPSQASLQAPTVRGTREGDSERVEAQSGGFAGSLTGSLSASLSAPMSVSLPAALSFYKLVCSLPAQKGVEAFLATEDNGTAVAVQRIGFHRLSGAEKKALKAELLRAERTRYSGLLSCQRGVVEDGATKAFFVVTQPYRRTLATAIEERRTTQTPFTDAEVLRIAGELARALRYLHSEKQVTNGLQPQNIVIGDGGEGGEDEYRLNAFGLGHVFGRSVRLGLVDDYAAYWAPEQLENERRHTERADMWALGVVLAEMCLLRRPFAAVGTGGLKEYERTVVRSLPIQLEARSDALVDIVTRLLVVNPGERPTAAMLCALLEPARGAD